VGPVVCRSSILLYVERRSAFRALGLASHARSRAKRAPAKSAPRGRGAVLAELDVLLCVAKAKEATRLPQRCVDELVLAGRPSPARGVDCLCVPPLLCLVNSSCWSSAGPRCRPATFPAVPGFRSSVARDPARTQVAGLSSRRPAHLAACSALSSRRPPVWPAS
jgi:hypothetical protein